jgi:beta-glucosidase
MAASQYLRLAWADNFEWAEGYGPRFGLYRVDYATFARTPTKAVPTFQAIRANLP